MSGRMPMGNSNQSFVIEVKSQENSTWQGTITWVEGKKKERLLFIYNPVAGKGKIKAKLSGVLELFSACGYELIVHPTDSKGDARRTALEYAKKWQEDVYFHHS